MRRLTIEEMQNLNGGGLIDLAYRILKEIYKELKQGFKKQPFKKYV